MADPNDPDILRDLKDPECLEEIIRQAIRKMERLILRYFIGALVIYLLGRTFIQ